MTAMNKNKLKELLNIVKNPNDLIVFLNILANSNNKGVCEDIGYYGLSRQSYRTSIKNLNNTGLTNHLPNHSKLAISVCNYDSYVEKINQSNHLPNHSINQIKTKNNELNAEKLRIKSENQRIKEEARLLKLKAQEDRLKMKDSELKSMVVSNDRQYFKTYKINNLDEYNNCLEDICKRMKIVLPVKIDADIIKKNDYDNENNMNHYYSDMELENNEKININHSNKKE